MLGRKTYKADLTDKNKLIIECIVDIHKLMKIFIINNETTNNNNITTQKNKIIKSKRETYFLVEFLHFWL
jgi:hypothetical protein